LNKLLTGNKAQPDAERGKFARILDAAESVFAESGFAGGSMRKIAQKANVAQALIHYHFQNKEKLFEAVIARRALEINGSRKERLIDILSKHAVPPLTDLVEALFLPTIAAGHSPAQVNNDFSRILASQANSPEPRSRHLVEKYYDPIARDFIAALQKSRPVLTKDKAVWAYLFAIGVGMMMMAQTGRANRLSDGQCDDGDVDQMMANIVPFICAGIIALEDRD